MTSREAVGAQAPLVGRNSAATRKLLERARRNVAAARRTVTASREEHQRLLSAFVTAASSGDVAALVSLLAEDAILMSDAGREGVTINGIRNLQRPLLGAARIAAFVAKTSARGGLTREQRDLNGQPALVLWRGDRPFAALLLAVADGKIHRILFHADLARHRHLGRGRALARSQ